MKDFLVEAWQRHQSRSWPGRVLDIAVLLIIPIEIAQLFLGSVPSPWAFSAVTAGFGLFLSGRLLGKASITWAGLFVVPVGFLFRGSFYSVVGGVLLAYFLWQFFSENVDVDVDVSFDFRTKNK